MDDGRSLRSARARAGAALRRGAPIRELQRAAVELGSALLATAEDRDLWDRLESGPGAFRAANLSEDQATQLQVIVDLDWARLLNESGYQPPPPAEAQALELQEALAEALNRGARSDLNSAREKLHSLAQALIEAGEQREVSRRELRRRLRVGMRVSAKVLVVIGVIVATGVAARQDVERGLEPANLETLELAYAMRTVELSELVEQWREVGFGDPSEELVMKTRRLYEGSTAAFYGAWDAAVGAPWYRDLEDLFYDVNHERERLRTYLECGNAPDPVATVDALQRFADLATRLQAAIDDMSA
jgi:hypothetical protein